ncbi:hypothetical protein JXA32_08760 [Candidatus Sumerlaeota bacterium]|nr:hypothetical protein [Candidatus Sumerlaeota bacterium]
MISNIRYLAMLCLASLIGFYACTQADEAATQSKQGGASVESSTSNENVEAVSNSDEQKAEPEPEAPKPPKTADAPSDQPKEKPSAPEQKESLRIAVAAHPEDEGADDVRMALEKILRKKGYTVYDFSQLQGVRHEEFLQSLESGDASKLKRWREDLKIDVAIDCRTKTRERGQIDLAGQPASNFVSKLECRLIDLGTAEVFESIEAEGQSAAMVEEKGREDARKKAAEKAASSLLKAIHAHQSE